jgi:hypothetical protein
MIINVSLKHVAFTVLIAGMAYAYGTNKHYGETVIVAAPQSSASQIIAAYEHKKECVALNENFEIKKSGNLDDAFAALHDLSNKNCLGEPK